MFRKIIALFSIGHKVTLNQLHDLPLHIMAAKLVERQDKLDIQSFLFDERFDILIDAEWTDKEKKESN